MSSVFVITLVPSGYGREDVVGFVYCHSSSFAVLFNDTIIGEQVTGVGFC